MDYSGRFDQWHPGLPSYDRAAIMYGYGKRFLSPGGQFTVYYDPDITPRDDGGDGPTVIHLKWD